jgi:thiol-disulfide isomerase/thioredoxin
MREPIFLFLVVLIAISALGGVEPDAINFTAVDINGNKITLSDFKNKVVILDFWATWCLPCRQEIPNLVDIKNTFRNKNFEIISIDGFERNGDDKAVQFVKENKMDWIHIIDKTVGGDLANKYEVRNIPRIFVIKDGKIVSSNLRGDDLKKKIGQLLR